MSWSGGEEPHVVVAKPAAQPAAWGATRTNRWLQRFEWLLACASGGVVSFAAPTWARLVALCCFVLSLALGYVNTRRTGGTMLIVRAFHVGPDRKRLVLDIDEATARILLRRATELQQTKKSV